MRALELEYKKGDYYMSDSGINEIKKGDMFIAGVSGNRVRLLSAIESDARQVCDKDLLLAGHDLPPNWAGETVVVDEDYIIKAEIDAGAGPGTKIIDIPGFGGARYDRLIYWTPVLKRWILIPLGGATGEQDTGDIEGAKLVHVVGKSSDQGGLEELTVEVWDADPS